ncbi:MAG: peptide chain release factor-like protein [Candidatus Omnitrophota bacterium]
MKQGVSPIFKTDLKSLEKETKVIFYKSSGPGGQRKNKRETAVRLHHIPSGLTVVATEMRLQTQNLDLAFRRLIIKLKQLNKRPKKRVSTAKPVAIREHIFEEKKHHSEKKKLRKRLQMSDFDLD